MRKKPERHIPRREWKIPPAAWSAQASGSMQGDVHTLTFEVGAEAVYRIEMTPRDLAGNGSDHRSTEVFEIDVPLRRLSKKETGLM